nr:NAD(P)-dependent oxidoreductase [Gemmatimonadota bacterium]
EAAGQVFNVGEPRVPTTVERLRRLAAVAGWQGRTVIVPGERLPAHLRLGALRYEQDLVVSTSRIRATLGVDEVVTEDEGLRRTFAWESEHPPLAVPGRELEYAAEDETLRQLDRSA